MSKKIVLALALLFTVTSVQALDFDNLIAANTSGGKSTSASGLDKETLYYPNATVKSAIAKYKAGNYTGCLQELFSVTIKEPSNALAYYYMAMAYTHLDMQTDAVEAYEKVISLNPNNYLTEYATKGRDCLTGGPACISADAVAAGGSEEAGEEDDLDKFVNSPYGNGLSQEMNTEIKQKELTNIKETINKKEILEVEDLQKIKDFDSKNNNQSYEEDETIKIAQVSDEEILQAVKTLKEAGLTLNVQTEKTENPYAQFSQYQDPKMAEMSMLLGNNNNNNSNNMMNMLPMLMQQAQKGENIDPRFMQAMMTNSMMTDWNFNTNNDNRY